MEAELFQIAKTTIDAGIDGWIGRPAGITMSFTLAAEFLRHGLLEEVEYEVAGARWLHRRYRGRIVQPDPELSDHDFFFGMRVL